MFWSTAESRGALAGMISLGRQSIFSLPETKFRCGKCSGLCFGEQFYHRADATQVILL
jgi:hypothetical protein